MADIDKVSKVGYVDSKNSIKNSLTTFWARGHNWSLIYYII